MPHNEAVAEIEREKKLPDIVMKATPIAAIPGGGGRPDKVIVFEPLKKPGVVNPPTTSKVTTIRRQIRVTRYRRKKTLALLVDLPCLPRKLSYLPGLHLTRQRTVPSVVRPLVSSFLYRSDG